MQSAIQPLPSLAHMPTSPAFVDHCLELLSGLGVARARRMFGGHGLYLDDLFIALIADEMLYLKADALSRARFEAAGCAPFRYASCRGESVMSYYAAPEEALESPALMGPWVHLARDAALRSRQAAAKPKAARKLAAKPTPRATRPR